MAPLCEHCAIGGTDTPATEERHGEMLCASCATSQDEAAHERSLEAFYGGGGPQTERERVDRDSMNRVRR